MQSTARAVSTPPRALVGRRLEIVVLIALCAVFMAMAWPFTSGLGIEVDEALAGCGLYAGLDPLYSIGVGGGRAIPLMLISYLGALKVWISAPFFAMFGADEITLRMPTVALGAAAVALFWFLLRAHGRRAAWIGSVLLATDTMFVLLTSTDFGPVVVQWFLKIAIMLLSVRWKRTDRMPALAGAAFLAGVAVWDKATFMWIGAGMFLGAALAFPADFKRALKPRAIGMAAAAFVVGASPFIVYNLAHPLATFRSNAHIAPAEIPAKFVHLRGTLDGSLVRGYMVAADTPPWPGRPQDLFDRAVIALHDNFVVPERNWMLWAILASLAALPFLWRTPARAPALFAAVSFAVGWVAMAMTVGGGAAAHHVALVWPMQFILVAVVFAELSRLKFGRVPVFIAVAALAIVNVAVTSRYYDDLIRNGPGIRWTTATYDLKAYLDRTAPSRIVVVDWGIYETLELLSEGALPAVQANDYMAVPPSSDRNSAVVRGMTAPGTIFVTHVPQWEQVPGRDAALDTLADRSGLKKIPIRTIRDSFGRDVFAVFRFQ